MGMDFTRVRTFKNPKQSAQAKAGRARGQKMDALAIRAKVDQRAKDELVRSMMPLLKSTADRWAKAHGQDFDDVLQDVSLGLLRGLEKWRPGAGNNFLTHAVLWCNAMGNRSGMRHSKEGVRACRSRFFQSLDESIGEDGSATFHDVVAAAGSTQAEQFEQLELDLIVRHALKLLPPVERDVMLERVLEGKTLQEVGDKRGQSREWIRQVQLLARERLKRRLAPVLRRMEAA